MKITDLKEQIYITRRYLGPYSRDGLVIETREGKKGIVLIVENLKSVEPKYIAFKTIKIKEDIIEKAKIDLFIQEAKNWYKVNGYMYILPALYIVRNKRLPLVCTPFCEYDLRNLLDKKNNLRINESLIFASQILKALIFAKQRGIRSHQDLKPENILIKDISNKYHDFDPSCYDDAIKYVVKVADFGMANAFYEVDMPQGSYPYMAPEQYIPEKYDSFEPDIFALGVILFEMITGKHPCDKKTKEVWNEWTRNKWKSWAFNESKFDEKLYSIPKDIKSIIKKMLITNPEDRPSENEILDEVLIYLKKKDNETTKQLRLMFEYYDFLTDYSQKDDRIRTIQEISQFPEEVSSLINEVKKEIDILKKGDKSQKDIEYLCRLCKEEAELFLKRNKASDRDRAVYYSELLIDEIMKIKDEISYEKLHPNLNFKGFKVISEPHYDRDFELYSEIIGYGIDILEKTIRKKKTKEYILKKDKVTISAYYLREARNKRKQSDLIAAKNLDICIEYNPNEPLFYYFKGIWLYIYYLMEARDKEKPNLQKEILNSINRAIKLDKKWAAPKIQKEIVKRGFKNKY